MHGQVYIIIVKEDVIYKYSDISSADKSWNLHDIYDFFLHELYLGFVL